MKKYTRPLTIEELEKLGDEDIDFSDIPELDKRFWKNAQIVTPEDRAKEQITLRLDPDMLEWFRAKGRGYQTQMNAVLRHYYESQRDQ
jgi:uncharacterized protein (DUF4415 family)